ncbi:MAG TPA: hypothetical protein VLT89_01425 [Usitatibacter sp.]|nr:hypothetical protein [Usitatibacter sp.]
MNKTRHVHLGERLQVIERIRSGALTPEQAANELEVPPAAVHEWLATHSNDRIYSLEEARVPPEVMRLSRRAQRLVELIETADDTIRVLNRKLVESQRPKSRARDA